MKSKSSELLDKSVAAMVSAIEIYNKPDFLYRGETFSILAINGWELLFKAKCLKNNKNKMRSLYVTEPIKKKDGAKSKRRKIKKTRSGNPFTHSIEYLANKFISDGELSKTVWDNISALIELRDSSIHFYNHSEKINVLTQEIGTATLKNYVQLYKKWFGKDLSSYNFYLMPLSFMKIPNNIDIVLLNSEEQNFLSYVRKLEENSDVNNEYSIALNTTVQFTKSNSSGNVPVRLSQEKDAFRIILTEPEIRDKYPFDYKGLTRKCQKRYSDFAVTNTYHEIRKKLKNNRKYQYVRLLDPSKANSGSKTFYSSAMFEELDKYYTRK